LSLFAVGAAPGKITIQKYTHAWQEYFLPNSLIIKKRDPSDVYYFIYSIRLEQKRKSYGFTRNQD